MLSLLRRLTAKDARMMAIKVSQVIKRRFTPFAKFESVNHTRDSSNGFMIAASDPLYDVRLSTCFRVP